MPQLLGTEATHRQKTEHHRPRRPQPPDLEGESNPVIRSITANLVSPRIRAFRNATSRAAALYILFFACCAVPRATTPHRLERILVARDSDGFVMAESKRPFRPWGFNYGNRGRLMEDFWEQDWKTIAVDFAKMKALGANIVRVHLQYGKFMVAQDQANRAACRQLAQMLRLAEKTGLYLDITGLACYRASDTPEWYNAADEAQRWAAQSNFWSAVAETCAGSPAVFCYDLMNEPIVPGGKQGPGHWAAGSFGGFDYVQRITLDPGARKREEIALEWIRVLTAAIRSRDTNALVTVGLLPWSAGWGHLSGFVPSEIAPHLDFISVHIYPDSKKPGEAMEALRKCSVRKPVVIEETFPLSCSSAEEETFLRESKEIACGWIGHYDGLALQDFAALERAGKLTLP